MLNTNLTLVFKNSILKSKLWQFGAKIEKSHQIYLKMCTLVNLKKLNTSLTGFSFSISQKPSSEMYQNPVKQGGAFSLLLNKIPFKISFFLKITTTKKDMACEFTQSVSLTKDLHYYNYPLWLIPSKTCRKPQIKYCCTVNRGVPCQVKP